MDNISVKDLIQKIRDLIKYPNKDINILQDEQKIIQEYTNKFKEIFTEIIKNATSLDIFELKDSTTYKVYYMGIKKVSIVKDQNYDLINFTINQFPTLVFDDIFIYNLDIIGQGNYLNINLPYDKNNINMKILNKGKSLDTNKVKHIDTTSQQNIKKKKFKQKTVDPNGQPIFPRLDPNGQPIFPRVDPNSQPAFNKTINPNSQPIFPPIDPNEVIVGGNQVGGRQVICNVYNSLNELISNPTEDQKRINKEILVAGLCANIAYKNLKYLLYRNLSEDLRTDPIQKGYLNYKYLQLGPSARPSEINNEINFKTGSDDVLIPLHINIDRRLTNRAIENDSSYFYTGPRLSSNSSSSQSTGIGAIRQIVTPKPSVPTPPSLPPTPKKHTIILLKWKNSDELSNNEILQNDIPTKDDINFYQSRLSSVIPSISRPVGFDMSSAAENANFKKIKGLQESINFFITAVKAFFNDDLSTTKLEVTNCLHKKIIASLTKNEPGWEENVNILDPIYKVTAGGKKFDDISGFENIGLKTHIRIIINYAFCTFDCLNEKLCYDIINTDHIKTAINTINDNINEIIKDAFNRGNYDSRKLVIEILLPILTEYDLNKKFQDADNLKPDNIGKIRYYLIYDMNIEKFILAIRGTDFGGNAFIDNFGINTQFGLYNIRRYYKDNYTDKLPKNEEEEKCILNDIYNFVFQLIIDAVYELQLTMPVLKETLNFPEISLPGMKVIPKLILGVSYGFFNTLASFITGQAETVASPMKDTPIASGLSSWEKNIGTLSISDIIIHIIYSEPIRPEIEKLIYTLTTVDSNISTIELQGIIHNIMKDIVKKLYPKKSPAEIVRIYNLVLANYDNIETLVNATDNTIADRYKLPFTSADDETGQTLTNIGPLVTILISSFIGGPVTFIKTIIKIVNKMIDIFVKYTKNDYLINTIKYSNVILTFCKTILLKCGKDINRDLIITGHSLGGGLTQIVSSINNIQGYGFNPVGGKSAVSRFNRINSDILFKHNINPSLVARLASWLTDTFIQNISQTIRSLTLFTNYETNQLYSSINYARYIERLINFNNNGNSIIFEDKVKNIIISQDFIHKIKLNSDFAKLHIGNVYIASEEIFKNFYMQSYPVELNNSGTQKERFSSQPENITKFHGMENLSLLLFKIFNSRDICMDDINSDIYNINKRPRTNDPNLYITDSTKYAPDIPKNIDTNLFIVGDQILGGGNKSSNDKYYKKYLKYKGKYLALKEADI